MTDTPTLDGFDPATLPPPAFGNPWALGLAALAKAIAPRKHLTVSEWADQHRQLSAKGSAVAGQWRTDRNPPLREPMDAMSTRSPVRDVVLMFPIQYGKALALDTPIPTPSGWTTMGAIQPGEHVLGADGRAARVIAASEVFADHPCYRLTFSDGSQVVADAGHRWTVVDTLAGCATVTITSQAIAEARAATMQSRHPFWPQYLVKLPADFLVPHWHQGAAPAPLRYITAIEAVPTVPTRCIAVDTADHLYLCGPGMVPTHNTEVAANVLGYCMAHDPGPIMVCLPGEVSMNKWVAQKLHPMIEETPALREALTSVASRDAANTRTFKDFAGGQLYIEHAGSPSRLKSTTVRTLVVDEVDEFANNLSGGDDPLEMLQGRTSAFPATAKRLYISTPQIRGISRIEALWDKSDQRRYFVPCPHCGHMQHLQWAGLHWGPTGAPWYTCEDCGASIDEHHKTAMIAAGQWQPTNPDGKLRGYHINCLYYQFGLGPRWADLVDTWRDVQSDPARLKTFVNDRLAEPWEDRAMRAVRHNAVADRAEPYPLRTAPAGVLAITAGVDTQDNRLAVHIVGWGRGMACWTIDYVELPGDPADDPVWVALTDLLNRPIQRQCGGQLRVEAMAQDAGGHRTEAVKAYSRRRLVRRPMVVFGATANNAPVLGKPKLLDVTWRGQTDKRGITAYQVGTVAAKHWLYSRLSTDADKPPEDRLVHHSADLPPEFFTGLVGEIYNPAKNRFEAKKGHRNEPLDTWVYAFAAAHHPELRLHRHTRADWDGLAQRQANQQVAAQSAQSLADQTPAPAQPATPPPEAKPPTVRDGRITLAGLRRR